MITQLLEKHGADLLYLVITVILGVIGIFINQIRANQAKKSKDAAKQNVADRCVKYVEQVYRNLCGEDKLILAMETASEMLQEQKISCTDLELRVLIESALAELNNVFQKENTEDLVELGDDVPADDP